jgi:biotin synthase
MMQTSLGGWAAGRTAMSDEMQALCLFAGVNSIFVGDTLLTAGNPEADKDRMLFDRLGLEPL